MTRANIRKQPKTFFSYLSKNDCAAILEEFEIEPDNGLKLRRNQVRAIKVGKLREKCKGMDIEGYKNLKKEELISALLEKVSIKPKETLTTMRIKKIANVNQK